MECILHEAMEYYHPSQDHVIEHSHNVYELVYYKDGTGITRLGNIAWPYEAHSAVLIAPGELHDETALTPSNVAICRFQIKDNDIVLRSTFIPTVGTNSENLERLLSSLCAERKERLQYYDSMIHLLLEELVYVLRRMLDGGRKADTVVDYLKLLLEKNYSNGTRLDVMAETVGYSYEYIRHLFKQSTGQSPYQYLLSVRVSAAKELLISTDMPVNQIALNSGFSSASGFVNAFKQYTLMTPLEYRRLFTEHGRGSVVNLNNVHESATKEMKEQHTKK